MQWCLVIALLVVACDGGTPQGDAARPSIDLSPYERACDVTAPCPAPYACVDDGTDHDTITTCLVPCTGDDQCPVDFFCNGVTTTADVGATFHCVREV